MNEEELRAFEAVQAEKEELGIAPTPEIKEEVIEAEIETKVEEEVVDDEAKPVSNKEVEPVDPKEYKNYKQTLKEELQKDFDEKLEKIKAELAKPNPDETKSENLEEEAKALALELNFDEAKTLALLKATRGKGAEMSEEDRQALKDLREMKEEREELKQQQLVDQEWKELNVNKQFPNASEEQITQAKERMEELARSEKYLDKEMDYILYKEKDTFDKILFSPKQKTFESGRRTQEAVDSDEEFPAFRPDMTPAEFERMEKRREAIMSQAPREKMLHRTTDESGRSVERYV